MRIGSTSPARWRTRAIVVLGGGLALVGVLAAPAMAGPYVNRSAAALRRNPVYVNSGARRALPAAPANALRAHVRHAGSPVYLAVLPASALKEAGSDPNRLAAEIAAGLGRDGTVGVAAGSRTGAGGGTLDPGVAEAAMRAASDAHRGDLSAILTDFVDRVDQAAAGEQPFWDRPLVRPLALLGGVLILIVLVTVLANSVRRRGRSRATGFADVQALAHEDITSVAADLRDCDALLEAADEDSQARRDLARAHEAYEQGLEAYRRAHSPDDFARVSTALEASRYYLGVARARFEGRPPLLRRPPCFFDTRHGPSVDDVGWIPQGGPPRPVPACQTCMTSIANGVEPPVRKVVSAGRRMPFYNAPPHFESWFAGYFGGAAASLVDGFPLGRALDDGYAGGLNTFGGGYGYLPVSYAETGVLDAGGADIGQLRPGADTELLVRPAGHDTDTVEG